MELKDIKTMIGYDEDMNEVLRLSDTSLQSIDALTNVTKAMNGFGVTVAEFTSSIQYTLSLLAKSLTIFDSSNQSANLPRPETDEITENPKRKNDYEIFDQKDELYIIPTDCKNIFLEEILWKLNQNCTQSN